MERTWCSVGRDSHFVLVRQGESYFCVHSNHLLKVSDGNNQNKENEIDQVMTNRDIEINTEMHLWRQTYKNRKHH